MASIIANLAFARALAIASPWPVDRIEMLDKVSSPTAITVSKIISDRVTINAKPG